MSIFGFGKRQKPVEDVSQEIDLKAVEAYLDAFMMNHGIDSERVLVQKIYQDEVLGSHMIIIQAAFPGLLIGTGGKIAKRLANGISRHIDRRIKLRIL